MIIKVRFGIVSFAAMITAELLIVLVFSNVELELGIVAIGLKTAKISADEANLSIEVVKFLLMKS